MAGPPPPVAAAVSGRADYGRVDPTARSQYNEYHDDPGVYATESYQSGSLEAQPETQVHFHGAHGDPASWLAYPGAGAQPDHASYVTSHGMSISNLCFAAWALPPFSGVLVLIFETANVSPAAETGSRAGLS